MKSRDSFFLPNASESDRRIDRTPRAWLLHIQNGTLSALLAYESGEYQMPYDATQMQDWQISEAAEQHMPGPREWQERLGLQQDEVIPMGRLAKLDFLKIIERLKGRPRTGNTLKSPRLHPHR